MVNDALFSSDKNYWETPQKLFNELCQYCGKYKQAHEGACDGCRWKQ